jgi:hypothetical protein
MSGPEFIKKVDKALEEIEGHGMLEAYAAHAAASVLAENWKAAIRDGTEPAKLTPDIDHTINELIMFRDIIAKEVK